MTRRLHLRRFNAGLDVDQCTMYFEMSTALYVCTRSSPLPGVIAHITTVLLFNS